MPPRYGSHRGFDPDRDIGALRGEFFGASPSSILNTEGLTGFQADFLTSEYVNRVLPIQKEISAIEDRRQSRAYNDLRLQEQVLQFELAKEESQRNRDLLTRLPALTAELGEVDELAKDDPETAAAALIGLQRDYVDLYVANPAAKILLDATERRVGSTAAKLQAEADALRQRASKFLAFDDPELLSYAEGMLGPKDAEDEALLQESGVLRKAAAKQRTVEAAAADAKSWVEQEQETINSAVKWLDELKSKEAAPVIAGIGKDGVPAAAPKPTVAPEDMHRLNFYAANAGITNPSADPFELRNQLYSALIRKKEQLRSGGSGSSVASKMRGPAAGR